MYAHSPGAVVCISGETVVNCAQDLCNANSYWSSVSVKKVHKT